MTAMAATRRVDEPENGAPIVVPVRYVARGRVVQSTSVQLSSKAVRVRSPLPPGVGLVVAVKLYLPRSDRPLAAEALVNDASFGDAAFTAEFTDLAGHGRAQIATFVQSVNGRRACGRVDVRLPILLRDAFAASDGVVTNLSASGLFVETDAPQDVGSRLRGEVRLPGDTDPHQFEAEVVRVADRGMGLQLVGGSDEFRTRLTSYLAKRDS
jgi:PilZ domain